MSYRRLTGVLLLWAVVPLPFLYVILPPFWLVAAAAALVALWRPQATVRLSPAVLNVLAVLILVVVVMTGGLRVGPVRPLGHLLLLLTAVRSLAVDDRASFLRTLPAVFLLWLVAVASSTHVALAVYLVLSVVVWWWAGMTILLVGLDPQYRWTRRDLPRLGHVLKATVVVALIAIPIFVTMPRLRSPWVAGRTMQRTSGFSTSVELARSGTISESRELALTLSSVAGENIEARWTRLRATAFNMVFAGSWAPRRAEAEAPPTRLGLVWLAAERADLEGTAELTIELLRPRGYLFIPEGTVAVRAPVPVLADPVGGLVISQPIREPITYSVWVDDQPVPRFDEPARRDIYLPKRNSEVRRLAVDVAGGLSGAQQRAEVVESYLRQNYQYSLDTSGVQRRDPVAWFLLSGRQGHCEFFASAMVVLLRHLGTPARLVAGYNGGALAPSGSSVVVREANAHTWVEVWLGPESGWQVFDPTPPEGVPALVGISGLERLRWAWQRVQDSWDRYVLTFGLQEQMGILTRAADLVAAWVAALSWRHLLLLAVLIAGLWALRRALGDGFDRHRRPGAARTPAARLVERLARRLQNEGVSVPQRATVRWIGAAAGHHWPAAVDAVHELVVLAEQELYDSVTKSTSAQQSRRLWTSLRQAMGTARQANDDDGKVRGL